ncbi:MAG: hypothetical protein GX962_03975 [Epulopiscium sp.]|nr:hypothetical protein [Candidatus Epulonipiscium sp.]
MKCRQADELMMAYLDGILTQEKAQELNIHLQNCDLCVESFYAYEQIKQELNEIVITEAPHGFTQRVMATVAEIDPQYEVQANPIENLAGIVWGMFSIFFGVGILLLMYQQEILNLLLSHPLTSSWIGQFIPTFDLLRDSIQGIQSNLIGIKEFIIQMIESGRNLLTVSLVVLGIVQYKIYRKEKVKI